MTRRKMLTCPNCSNALPHEPDGCVLEALIGVIRDRGNVPEKKLLKLWSRVDVDLLWDQIGPIVDQLEQGELS